jgi:hypothetical protein
MMPCVLVRLSPGNAAGAVTFHQPWHCGGLGMAHANWKGHLKLSLVSCPVALFPATTLNEKVSFHFLNKANNHRLKQQYIDAETDEIVERDDRIRGYEVSKGKYVTVGDDELAAVTIESSHTMEIDSFVARATSIPSIPTRAIISRPTTMSASRPSVSFARRWRRARWSAWRAWCSMAASVS